MKRRLAFSKILLCLVVVQVRAGAQQKRVYEKLTGLDCCLNQPGWGIIEEKTHCTEAKNIFYSEKSSNRYFKLRFTDFYNSSGVKGYPTFEIQEL